MYRCECDDEDLRRLSMCVSVEFDCRWNVCERLSLVSLGVLLDSVRVDLSGDEHGHASTDHRPPDDSRTSAFVGVGLAELVVEDLRSNSHAASLRLPDRRAMFVLDVVERQSSTIVPDLRSESSAFDSVRNDDADQMCVSRCHLSFVFYSSTKIISIDR